MISGIRAYSVVLAAGLVAWGCATEPPAMRDGKPYGVTEAKTFRGRWWSYYERGTSFLAGEFYEEAAMDFKKALTGRDRDSWQARTYGLHFVDYFPNRELGIAYYKTGRLDEAEQYLQASLDHVDTDRAHHFIDLVTRAKIAQGAIEDATAPVLEVEEVVVIAERAVPIEIKASDDVGVAAVEINGEVLPQRGSAEQVAFKKEILLEEGTHEIEVTTIDLADKEVTETIKVTVDLTGPTIGIFAPADPTVTENVNTVLEGIAIDDNPVVSVALSERVLAESGGDKRLEFAAELPLGRGENSFVLIAKDITGNETRSAVKVFRGRPDSMAARLWVLEQKAPHLLQYAANGFPDILMGLDICLAAADESLLIKLKSPKPDRPYRHNRTLRISGDVVCQTKIASLEINGQPFEALTGAPKESFNRRIPIDVEGPGKASISIAATDDQGNKAEQAFEVDISPIELDSPDSKMPVAVLAFGGSKVEADTSLYLARTTEQKLHATKRFNLLEREQLEAILVEQQLAVSALTDPAQSIALGKLFNVQVFLAADVFQREDKGVEIKARAISVETTKILATLDVYIEDKDDIEKVGAGCANLAAQLVDTFPRLSGELTSVKGNKALVNWTREDGVLEGMYLLVVHQEEPWIDDDTGEVLEEGEIVEVGRARIDRVTTGNTTAVLSADAEAEGAELATGMAAITM